MTLKQKTSLIIAIFLVSLSTCYYFLWRGRLYRAMTHVVERMLTDSLILNRKTHNKSTDIDLVQELIIRDSLRYADLIMEARMFYYHDDLSPFDCPPLPKMLLLHRLSEYPELMDIAEQVAEGQYSESCDCNFYTSDWWLYPEEIYQSSL